MKKMNEEFIENPHWYSFAANLSGYPNTTRFKELVHLLNEDYELAKTIEVLNGDSESAIDWLYRIVPRLKKRPIDCLKSKNGIRDLKRTLLEWYDVPPPYNRIQIPMQITL